MKFHFERNISLKRIFFRGGGKLIENVYLLFNKFARVSFFFFFFYGNVKSLQFVFISLIKIQFPFGDYVLSSLPFLLRAINKAKTSFTLLAR